MKISQEEFELRSHIAEAIMDPSKSGWDLVKQIEKESIKLVPYDHKDDNPIKAMHFTEESMSMGTKISASTISEGVEQIENQLTKRQLALIFFKTQTGEHVGESIEVKGSGSSNLPPMLGLLTSLGVNKDVIIKIRRLLSESSEASNQSDDEDDDDNFDYSKANPDTCRHFTDECWKCQHYRKCSSKNK